MYETFSECSNPDCNGDHNDLYFVNAFDIDEDGDADTFGEPDIFYLCMVCGNIMR